MRADLHIHTYYSDGAYSPREIAARAARAGVDLISMTDHDSLEGLPAKRAAAREAGLAYVSGWEVSSYAGDAKVHVLGYGCAPCEAYENFLAARREGAIVRAKDMIEKANAYFSLHLTLEDAERFHLKKQTPLHTERDSSILRRSRRAAPVIPRSCGLLRRMLWKSSMRRAALRRLRTRGAFRWKGTRAVRSWMRLRTAGWTA